MSVNISNYPQAIVHVDCDAFFASCEKARDPSLEGRPVATGKERGIVSCPSYEAKSAGIKRGMRLSDARKICPELVILPSDYELYSIYSERIFTILRRFTPQVEEYSIDEAYCDLAGLRRLYRASYPEIARMIKEAVRHELGLTVSVGLSLSKTLAKLASKAQKPDGFVAIPGRQIHEFLAGVPLEKVCGFGPNTVALLEKHGLRTVLDYVRRDISFADKLLGKVGRELWMELRGEPVYAVSTEPKEKHLSISKTKTFSPPSYEKEFVYAQLVRNLESAFIKLRRHGLAARRLTIYLRRQDFSSTGAEARATRHTCATLDFMPVLSKLFDDLFEEKSPYRSTGVILSEIQDGAGDLPDLFDDPVRIEKSAKISGVIDDASAAYGKHSIHLAASCEASQKRAHPRNDLAFRKKELLPGETFRQRLKLPLYLSCAAHGPSGKIIP